MNATVTSIQTARTREPVVYEELLQPCEVAKILRVDPKTVTRWARQGRLRFVWTPGGHRRYFAADLEHLLAATRQERVR